MTGNRESDSQDVAQLAIAEVSPSEKGAKMVGEQLDNDQAAMAVEDGQSLEETAHQLAERGSVLLEFLPTSSQPPRSTSAGRLETAGKHGSNVDEDFISMKEFYFGGCGIRSTDTFCEDELQEAVYALDALLNADSQQATYHFTGEMGITYDDEGFVEKIHPGGQAFAIKRIARGDQIVKVGRGKYSKDAVVVAENSGDDYEITFRNKASHLDELFNTTLASISGSIDAKRVRDTWEQLTHDKEAILNVIDGHFKKPHFHRGEKRSLGFSKIQFGGVGLTRDVVLVPSSMQATAQDVKDVLGKKNWNTQPPEMVLQIDMGTRHPGSLSNDLMRGLPAFRDIVRSAQKSASRKKSNQQVKEDEANDGDVEREVNGVIYRLLRENVDAVLQASFMAHNWVFIDRRTGLASSPAAELLVEELAASIKNGPRIVSFESISRYKEFKPSFAVNRQLLVLMDVVANSIGGGGIPSVTRVDTTYNVENFSHWEGYHCTKARRKIDHMNQHGMQETGNRRLPRAPEEEMIAVDDVTGARLYDENNRPIVTPQSKWVYHYRQYLFSSATNYVIFQDALTSEFPLKVRPGPEWPMACLFAHGGNLTYTRLQKHLAAGLPTVLLYNTGGVTQTFGYLYKKCVLEKEQTHEVAKNADEDVVTIVVEKAEITSREPWTKEFGTPDVASIVRLEQRAPSVMRRNVAFIDTLEMSVEQVVDKLTNCFASSTKGLPELGLGTACDDITLEAWAKAILLHERAVSFKSMADRLYYFSLALGMLASLIAIVVSHREESVEDSLRSHLFNQYTAVMDFLNRVLILLPIFSGILATIMSEWRYLQKWGSLHTTSWTLTSEIYKFRCRIGDYDEFTLPITKDEDEEDEESGPLEPLMTDRGSARSRFVSRVNQLFNDAIEVLGDEMVGPSSKQLDIDKPQDRHQLKKDIQRFVDHDLFPGISRSSMISSERAPNAKVVPQFGLEVEDDFISEMVIEGYIEFRVKAVLKRSHLCTPSLVTRLKRIKLMSVLLMSFGTLLVIFKLQVWVTFTVALATVSSSIAQYQSLAVRIAAHNNVIRDLEGLKNLIDGQSIVQRRTRLAVAQCVMITEACLLNTVTAWTGVTFSARPTHHATESGETGK